MTAVDLSLFPDDETTEAMVGGNPPKACFFCGDALPAGPCVIWHGSHQEHRLQIGLHPECAIQLAAHLGHDALNARHHKTIDKTLSSSIPT